MGACVRSIRWERNEKNRRRMLFSLFFVPGCKRVSRKLRILLLTVLYYNIVSWEFLFSSSSLLDSRSRKIIIMMFSCYCGRWRGRALRRRWRNRCTVLRYTSLKNPFWRAEEFLRSVVVYFTSAERDTTFFLLGFSDERFRLKKKRNHK